MAICFPCWPIIKQHGLNRSSPSIFPYVPYVKWEANLLPVPGGTEAPRCLLVKSPVWWHFTMKLENLLAKIQAFVSHLMPISGGSMSALIHQMSYMFIPGWWYTYPSEKIWKSMVRIIPYIEENKKCSKPPTSTCSCMFVHVSPHLLHPSCEWLMKDLRVILRVTTCAAHGETMWNMFCFFVYILPSGKLT